MKKIYKQQNQQIAKFQLQKNEEKKMQKLNHNKQRYNDSETEHTNKNKTKKPYTINSSVNCDSFPMFINIKCIFNCIER